MTSICFLLVSVSVIGCVAGYAVASRDLLQQIFLARKLTHRLAECLCAALVLLLQMLFSPATVLCVIPAAVATLYVLSILGLKWLLEHKESDSCTDDHRRKTRETVLCTLISCLAFVEAGFLMCLAITYLPNTAKQLSISAVSQSVCCGISMGGNTLLLAALVHYLLVLRMYPNDDDNPSRELLQLRKELRIPYRI